MVNCQFFRIKDICCIKSGKRLPKGTDFSEEITPYKYIRARDIKKGKISLEKLVCIDEQIKKKLSRYIINENDIAITIVGENIGDVGFCQKECDRFNLTENAVRLTNFTELVDSKFLAMYLNQQFMKEYMRILGSGAAQGKLGVYKIEKIKIPFPDYKTQKKIANILSCYDEAIENNNKRIKLLEQMAQNLYKEWFVRFRFPGWENCEFENGIPVGWHQGRLSELLEFKRGKNITADEMEDGDVSVISAGLEPSGYHSTSNVQGVSLTISSSGANAGYLSIHYEDIWAADCMFITEKNTQNIYYLYELLNNIRLVIFNQQRGAAQPHVYSKDINNLRLWIPNEELIENANKLFESFHKEIYQLQRANKNLAKQRDLLLPRLMSGKLEV